MCKTRLPTARAKGLDTEKLERLAGGSEGLRQGEKDDGSALRRGGMMVCKTPAALEMAIKAAAKASPLETGRARFRLLLPQALMSRVQQA